MVLLLAGCGGEGGDDGGTPCSQDSDCAAGQACVDGGCTVTADVSGDATGAAAGICHVNSTPDASSLNFRTWTWQRTVKNFVMPSSVP